MLKNIKQKSKQKNEIVVKDFFAEWCQPCKLQHNVIEELKKRFYTKVRFEYIDIDKQEKITDKFKIMAVPTIIIMKNEKIVNKFIGLTTIKIIENELNNILKDIY